MAIAISFIALYFYLDLNKLHALYYGADNGIFLQTLVNFAHTGSAFNWAEMRSHWYVHDSWLLITLVPFVRMYPYQETLIAAQVCMIGFAAVGLYAFSRLVGVEKLPAILLSMAFLIAPSVQGFAYNDFSESLFEPLLIFGLAGAVYKRSIFWVVLFAQALLGVKEDVGLFLIWFGVIGAIWYDRKLGGIVTILALVNVVSYYLIVGFFGQHASMPRYALSWPHPTQNIAFLIETLVPFAFAPLFLRWRVFVVLPLLAELFLANDFHFPFGRTGVHYTVALICLFAVATALVLREHPRLARWSLALSCIMALFFNTTVLHVGRHLYRADDKKYEAARALVARQDPAVFRLVDEGAWSVAAGDVNARLIGFGHARLREKPAWNTSKQ
ncbi:MAG: DUF2079 domain-containing protein [Candidatus Baltobacteraceae bacterium]